MVHILTSRAEEGRWGWGREAFDVRPKTGRVKAKIGANRKIDSSHVTDHRENYLKAVVAGSNLIPVEG